MFSIIVAVSENGIIGKDNSLIWNIPEDLKRFKEITMGKTIVMGRKTFESLPFVLPGRNHIVLTRDKNYKFNHPQVKISHDYNEVINLYKNSSEEVFIIGGGEIYKTFLDHAEKLYITEVLENFNGDTYFPKIDFDKWVITTESKIYTRNNINFKFINYIIKNF